MLTRINNTIYKYYYLTLVFILLLFKRRIPKWMQKEVKENLKPMAPPLGKIIDYKK